MGWTIETSRGINATHKTSVVLSWVVRFIYQMPEHNSEHDDDDDERIDMRGRKGPYFNIWPEF